MCRRRQVGNLLGVEARRRSDEENEKYDRQLEARERKREVEREGGKEE